MGTHWAAELLRLLPRLDLSTEGGILGARLLVLECKFLCGSNPVEWTLVYVQSPKVPTSVLSAENAKTLVVDH